MSEHQLNDANWFTQYPDRHARIRGQWRKEMEAQFLTLGDHSLDRRRILVWRIPFSNPMRGFEDTGLLRIPFLLFADETIENDDAVLLPIIDGIMRDAARDEAAELIANQERNTWS